MSVQLGMLLSTLAKHPKVTHFELRPLDRTGTLWQLSYRLSSERPPAYSGACRGTLHDVVVDALHRAGLPGDTHQPPPPTRKIMRRR